MFYTALVKRLWNHTSSQKSRRYGVNGDTCSLVPRPTVHVCVYTMLRTGNETRTLDVYSQLMLYISVLSLFCLGPSQADYIKHRSEIIQSLTPQEFALLWDSLRQCKLPSCNTIEEESRG